jgi:hypothetical protein
VFAEIRAVAAGTGPAFEGDYRLPGRTVDDPLAFSVAMTDLLVYASSPSAVSRLAEAGCEVPLISAVTGHSPKSVDQSCRAT